MEPSHEKSVPTMVRPSSVRTETFSETGGLVERMGIEGGREGGGGTVEVGV